MTTKDRNINIDRDELELLPSHLQDIVTAPVSPEQAAWLDEEARRLRAEGKTVIGWNLPEDKEKGKSA